MNNYYLVKNEKEYQELIKTPRNEFKGDRIRMVISKRNNKMKELLSKKCYFNGDKKIEGKEYLEFHYFLRKYTYLYLTKKGDSQIAKKIFEERGNWRPYNSKKDKNKVDFLYYLSGFGSYDKSNYYIKSLLRNLVDDNKSIITRKDLLFEKLKNIPDAKRYLVKNYTVNMDKINYEKIEKIFQSIGVLIFKPVGGKQGKYIEIFDSFEKFKKYTKSNEFKESEKKLRGVFKKENEKYKNWVLQEYIVNPLLIDGKKFHIRGYYLVHQNKKYLMNEGEIWYTKKDFVLRNFEDSDIHGLKYNEFLLKNPLSVKIYPKDLNVNQKIKDNIGKQFKNLFHLVGRIDEYFKCFTESKDCFKVFGFDAMITDDYQVKLLEINRKPGVSNLNSPYGKKLFENQIKLMVDTTFPPKNKVDEDSGFKRVY